VKVQSIFIDDIKVGSRRREDYGDIAALASSINKFGLIQPIVVDGELNLVAGGRRLRAFQELGRAEIDARFYEELTEDERNEIELEENLQRLNLSATELSNQIVHQAIKIAPIISTKIVEKEISLESGKSETRGRKSAHGVPKKDIAQALGISTSTLVAAEQHVAAVEEFPEISNIPTQKDALTVAKNLRQLPQAEQSQARQALADNDQDVLAALAEKPPCCPCHDGNAPHIARFNRGQIWTKFRGDSIPRAGRSLFVLSHFKIRATARYCVCPLSDKDLDPSNNTTACVCEKSEQYHFKIREQ
jgi:ParB-like chromosome segregation protein Spo0J